MRVSGRRAPAVIAGTLTLAWLGLVGCGGSVATDAQTKTEVAPVPLEQWQSQVASQLCKTYTTCCQSARLSHNYEQCVDRFAPQVDHSALIDGEKYDANVAGRCIDTVTRLASSCLLQDLWSPKALEACTPLFQGTGTLLEAMGVVIAELGEPCDSTCTSFGSCSAPRGGIPKQEHVCSLQQGLLCAEDGHCQLASNVGQLCDGNLDCVEELRCHKQRCIELRATGPCTDGGFCAGASNCINGQCVPKSIVSPEFCAGEF